MKRVLITGANSYIGTSFENWIKENRADIETETIDMKGNAWEEVDFKGYDAVFHVAGIAHADAGKVKDKQKALYYQVNCELAIKCAMKAKAEGVRQFLFMSSMIVYGESGGIGTQRVITRDTPPAPANFYGDSKVRAEEGLQKLADDTFKVVILRPPMIYGKGAKGNYPLLSKMAHKLPAFPNVKNERSMLYVGILCNFVSLLIQNEEQGIFFPQNAEYVQTSHMVRLIAEACERKIRLTRLCNPFLHLFALMGGKPGRLVNKAFGNMVYDKSLSVYKEDYQMYSMEESIRLTEVSE